MLSELEHGLESQGLSVSLQLCLLYVQPLGVDQEVICRLGCLDINSNLT